MRVKRSGKTIYGAELTAAEKKAMNMEIERQLAEFTRKHAVEIEALVLRQIRRKLDYDEAQLREFFDSFDDDLEALCKYYEMGEEDKAWLCTHELKEEGFDVEQWHKEKWPHEEI